MLGIDEKGRGGEGGKAKEGIGGGEREGFS